MASDTSLVFSLITKDKASGGFDQASESIDRMKQKMSTVDGGAADGLTRFGNAADTADTRAMGFRDTLTGVQDTMAGTAMLAKGPSFEGFLTLGAGIGDLGSGIYNFLVPSLTAMKSGLIGVKIQAALAWLAALGPIPLIIAGLVALGVGLVLLWKKSETFRNIVKGAFNAVWSAIKWVWDWTKKNWPLLLGILAGPIGWATLAITKNWDKIKAGGLAVWRWLSGLPGKIASGFSKVGQWISAPFRWGFNAISRFWNSTAGRLAFRVPSWVPGIGGAGWSMPRLPMLAKGGMIRGAGFAIVGEAGPEVVHLPTGAAVSPLGRGGPQEVRIVLEARGADRATLTFLRSLVRVYGQGSPEKAFKPI
ncbi:hypothetical protein [Actinomadura chokoriensis]|uniref:hypothetical protein n=1 Tax=Actinomadura chokoriensis TaxID=454156 RepID=UPI0031F8ED2A